MLHNPGYYLTGQARGKCGTTCPLRDVSPARRGLPRALAPARKAQSNQKLVEPRQPLTVTQGLFGGGKKESSTATAPPPDPADAGKWWRANSDLFTEVHDDNAFYNELNNSNKSFIAVEWYAPWCKGCEKSYPEVCKLLRASDNLRNSIKFMKVNVEELPKPMVRAQGVTALPRMSLYRAPSAAGLDPCSNAAPPRPIAVLDIPFSKVKNLKQSLTTVLNNPDSAFAVDPNGFIMATGPALSPEQMDKAAQKRKAEAAALEAGGASIFEKLKAAAGLDHSDKQPSQPAQATPASSNGTGTSTDATSSSYLAPFVRQYGEAFTKARQDFLQRHPEYGYNGQIDELYPKEVGVRMKPLRDGQVQQHYLDYTGSGVYTQSQLEAIFDELRNNMFGNPHSQNPSASLSTDRIDEVRRRILRHFNADPADWQLVFTRSATGALQLVGETFPWSASSMFRYLRTNHNSVLGIREYAIQHGGSFQAIDESVMDEWLGAASSSPHDHNDPPAEGSPESPTYSLFGFPAEDNYAGVKFPLDWAKNVKQRSTEQHKWMVLVDAAAFVPTQPLDLSKLDADFVDITFYKLFGYPTGLGALLVRTEVVPLLHKVFWGGGSVALATPGDNFHTMKCKPSDKLEDGTVSFLDIISLRHGFDFLDKLGGVSQVQAHTEALRSWTYDALSSLRHSNGAPIVEIYGMHAHPDCDKRQGPILNFQLKAPDGSPLSYRTFEREAAEAGFHVRTGAECNPGACYAYLGVKEEEVEALAGEKEGCDDDIEFVQRSIPAGPRKSIHSSEHLAALANSTIRLGHPAEIAMKWINVPLGSVRVSLGYMSTFEDSYALVDFIRTTYFDRQASYS
ncbi:pyridoxal phosphate-dependent transferase [Dunaliella salina]|uniref:Pyridoxal phosphate-dependent transferase n=1 Tax=Dunaliella salina TaxID=3046 RepID=A0ABQ7H786_DUNSA|nr:pyridoxal phosphate-dependent transferase [Dunaliella salina]|eukprot:KAF5842717.1 pyridoxal phosphate-dependent transferase [Dunaliella salina]